jgi:outer membrane protein
MKKFLTLLALAILSVSVSNAQGVRIGYTNVEYILSLMPETKQVELELAAYEKTVQAELQVKYNNYQTKLKEYESGYKLMSDLIREDKEKELLQMRENIQAFEERAQGEMEKMQMTKLEPLLMKVQAAIDKVAAANGFTYILSSHTDYGGSAIILYAKNKEDDISNLVLKELGITPPVEQTTTGEQPQGGVPIKK